MSPCGGDLDPLHVEATNLGAGGFAEKLLQQQQARCKPRTHDTCGHDDAWMGAKDGALKVN